MGWALWWELVALGCGRWNEKDSGVRTAPCVQNGSGNMSGPYPGGSDDPPGTPLRTAIYTRTPSESGDVEGRDSWQCPTRGNRPAGHTRADRTERSWSWESTNEGRGACEGCKRPWGSALTNSASGVAAGDGGWAPGRSEGRLRLALAWEVADYGSIFGGWFGTSDRPRLSGATRVSGGEVSDNAHTGEDRAGGRCRQYRAGSPLPPRRA